MPLILPTQWHVRLIKDNLFFSGKGELGVLDFELNMSKGGLNIEQNTDMPILDQKETLVEISREDALNENLLALKGHRAIGGIRASIYNAMNMKGVEALVSFMGNFEKKSG